jgi:hypothetical protein
VNKKVVEGYGKNEQKIEPPLEMWNIENQRRHTVVKTKKKGERCQTNEMVI